MPRKVIQRLTSAATDAFVDDFPEGNPVQLGRVDHS